MTAKKTSPKTEVKASKFPAYKCYVTYAAGSVLAGGFQLEDKISEDLGRFNHKQRKPPRAGTPEQSSERIGFDTEYSSSGSLLTVGVADTGAAIAYEVSEKDYVKKTRKVIRNAKCLVGHSIGGDLDHLVRMGLARDEWLRGTNIRDSFLLARMCDENRGKGAYGLETLLLSEMNFSSWKDATAALLKKTGNAADWSPEQRMERCRLDAWATVVLAKHFEEKMRT